MQVRNERRHNQPTGYDTSGNEHNMLLEFRAIQEGSEEYVYGTPCVDTSLGEVITYMQSGNPSMSGYREVLYGFGTLEQKIGDEWISVEVPFVEDAEEMDVNEALHRMIEGRVVNWQGRVNYRFCRETASFQRNGVCNDREWRSFGVYEMPRTKTYRIK